MNQPNLQVVTVTQDDIDTLRRMTAVTMEQYTDQALADEIGVTASSDGKPRLYHASERIWRHKAAAYSDLVDVAESGSERKLSQLQRSALAQASYYGGLARGVESAAQDVALSIRVPGRSSTVWGG